MQRLLLRPFSLPSSLRPLGKSGARFRPAMASKQLAIHVAFVIVALCSFLPLQAQLTGVKTIPGDYATFAAAVTDLNTQGVGPGGVTFNIAAGYTEANVAAVLTVATNPPNSARPIIFQKSGAGANPLFTAAVGTSTTVDGIVKLNGVDYVTFNGIDLQENAANLTATTQMEWGYALVKTSTTNGSQYNTIKNCTVTLNKANTASVGIYIGNHIATTTTGLTIASFLGTSSYNKFYNNTVQNSFHGIDMTGFGSAAPFEYYDQGNQIGVDGVSTRRNQILNFGGGAVGTANGITANFQNQLKIFNTYIDNAGGAATATTLNGILTGTANNANIDIYNDTITLASGATTSTLIGINNGSGGLGVGNTVKIYNCVVTGCSYPTATSGEFRGIAQTAIATYTHMYNNTVSNNSQAGSGTFSAIFYGGASTTAVLDVRIYGNTISGNNRTGTTGIMRLINADVSTFVTNVYDNVIFNNANNLSSGATYAYYNFLGLGFGENVYNNQIYNLQGGTGETIAIFASSGPAAAANDKRISGNVIHDITANTTAAMGAILVDYSMVNTIYQNNIYNIINNNATGGTPAAYGIRLGTNNNIQSFVYNNFISEIEAPNSSNTAAVRGLSLEGSIASWMGVYNNSIYLNASSAGTTFGTAGAFLASTPISIDFRNNIVVNVSVPGATGGNTVALQRASAILTGHALTSGYNCLYAGVPAANRLVHNDGTNSDQTLQEFKNRVGPREQASFSELPPFVNVTTSPYDLHLQTGSPTQCERGGKPVAEVPQDFDGNARNATTPDVGADELAGTFNDIASPDIQYTLLTNSGVAATRPVPAFATITDPSGINTTIGTNPRLYYKKSTNANTYVNNTNATDGWKYVEASNAISPFSFTIDYSLLFGGGGVVAGDIIQYFVVAQDLNGTPRIGLNNGGFTVQPTSVALAAANFPLNNTINQYTIIATTYSGVVPVGPTETITSLTNAGGAFALLNAGVLSGNVTLNITGDLTAETGTNALNQWAEQGGAGYTVSIVPSAAVTRVISGSHATLSLIRLDGADRVMIDGRFSGSGRFLTFRNTSNSAPTIGFINDAQNNTVRNSIIESGNTSVTTTAGGAVFIGTTTGPLGNDNNTITANEIRDRSDVAGTPAIGINSAGTTTTPTHFNSGITISNNDIHDWFLLNNGNQFGIQIGAGNTNFTITGNSLYQTSTRTNTVAGAVTRGINITNATPATTVGGFVVNDNFIGGTAPGATGGDWTLTAATSQTFGGISLTTGLMPSSIQNNIIRKINFTTNAPAAAATMFFGINAAQGIINVGTTTGNTIGSPTGNGSINITINAGGAVNSFLAGVLAAPVNGYVNVDNNTIGGWTISGTTLTGGIIPQYIQIQGTPVQSFSISNNLIGSITTVNSIQNTVVAAPSVPFGIRLLVNTGASATISNNIIQNVTNMGTAAGSVDYGILLISTVGANSPLTVTNNTIKDFTSNAPALTPTINTVGISLQGYGGKGHNISGNTITGIVNANTGTHLGYAMGIQVQGNSTGGTMSKNKVWDLRNANTGAGAGLAGMYFTAGDGWNVTNNMVSITNGVATNGLALFGIAEYCTGSFTMAYNSVFVGGTTAGTLNTYAFARGNTSTISLKNNLLYNGRNSGAGFSYAVGNLAAVPGNGWNSASSAYNTFVSPSSARMGEWGTGVNQTFTQWKASSGGDVESYADTTLSVPSISLFTNTTTGDLTINPATVLSWYVNGKGIAGTASGSIPDDFGGTPRSTTLGTPTDIGADEFTPNVGVNPIPAIASAAPALSTTTTYSFAGRKVGEITWGATGTVPSSITWTYYSSVPPIGAPGSNINSYWEVAAGAGGSGYSYDLKQYYTVHEQNALADAALNQAKRTGASPWYYYAGLASADAAGKFYLKTGLNSFSQFSLGTSAPSPTYTITASVTSGSGGITPSGAVGVAPLNNQRFTITPAACHVIDSVFADGVFVGAVSSYEFTNVEANHTLDVEFRDTSVTPSVTIAASPGTTICAGTNVTFTATPVNGGGSPAYQWYLNGTPVGTNSPTYANSTLVNGDAIAVILTNGDPCVSPTTDTSNVLFISVVSSVTPSVSIVVSPNDTICPGASATFTATAVNAGTTPSYQWRLNGGNVGTNSPTYVNGSLVTGDQVNVEVTSNDPCASPVTANSNTITMTAGDFAAPTAVCQNLTVALNASGNGSTTATAVNNGSTDNCTASGSLGLGISPSSFTCANLGANNVVLTVTDAASNTNTCVGVVTVVDNILPAISCPGNSAVNADPGQCTAAVTYSTPSGTDNCTPSTSQTAGLASGASFPVGVTTNTFRVTDASSNSATCSFTVTVTDNQAPGITCPGNMSVGNGAGQCSAVVTYSTPNGTDNCGGSSTTQVAGQASGTAFPVGVTTNTFRVTDGASNSATCSFTVTVTDTESPTWSACPSNITASTGSGTCDAVVTWTAPSSADNCSVSSSSGTHNPGATFPLGTTTVTYSATDANSNTGSCSFTVTVSDNTAPNAVCQNVTVTLDAFGNGSTTAAAVDNGSSDACGVDTLVLSQTAFTCADAGANTVVLTVTDDNGNTSTCNATVTVNAQAVTGTATGDTLSCGYNVSCAGGSDGTVHATGGGGCPGYTYLWSTGDTTGTVTGLGAGTYTVTVTDGAGGTSVGSVTLTAPAAITVTVGATTSSCPGDSTGSVDITPAGGNDCLPYAYIWSNGATTQDLSNVPAGSYTVTVTDNQGCTATQTVTVGAFTAPSPSFTQAGNTLTSTQAWATYQWLLNGSPISGANSISHTVTVTGNYSLMVTDANGCSGTSAPVLITGVGGGMDLGLTLYPNPARGEFRLRTASPIGHGLTVSIMDMYGHRLAERALLELSHEAAFDIRGFSAGTYFVEIVTEYGQRRLIKLVVQ